MSKLDIPNVSSLADLRFKAKSNPYYIQLTLIAANAILGSPDYNVMSKDLIHFESAFEVLCKYPIGDANGNCTMITQIMNERKWKLQLYREDKPVVKPRNKDGGLMAKILKSRKMNYCNYFSDYTSNT